MEATPVFPEIKEVEKYLFIYIYIFLNEQSENTNWQSKFGETLYNLVGLGSYLSESRFIDLWTKNLVPEFKKKKFLFKKPFIVISKIYSWCST